MKKLILSCIVSVFSAFALQAQDTLTHDTMSFSGQAEAYVIPSCADSVFIQTWGAQGGFTGSTAGGQGGYAEGYLIVTPGDTLWAYVGGKGLDSPGGTQACNLAGGWNGGGPTGDTCCSNAGSGAASGGGASDIRYGGQTLNDRVIVGAGGGGSYSSETGGDGGGLTGANGGSYNGVTATGGTQTAGGQPGGHYTSHTCNWGTAGTFGYGGKGDGNDGGGGGAGWYGGGGGANNAGGAGGSSYIGGVNNGSTTTGVNTGDGRIIITVYGTSVAYTPSQGDTMCTSQSPIALSGGTPTGGTYSGPGVSSNMFDPSAANLGWNIISYTYANCTASTTDSIYVVNCASVEDYEFKNEQLTVYPNPASEDVFIQLDDNQKLENARLKVMDINGRIVHTESANGNKIKISGEVFERNGIYLFTIEDKDAIYSGKVVYKQ